MRKLTYILALTTLISFAQQTPAPKQTKSILIMGGTAHLGNGKVIENSAIGFKDGKIILTEVIENLSKKCQTYLTENRQ